MADSLEGTTLSGSYELVAHVGSGSYGDVYRARQISTGQTVAVKVLRPRVGPNSPAISKQVERFEREMRVCAALQHPNIVRAIDCGATPEGLFFSVFEYVSGVTLRQALSERGAFPVTVARDLMLQVLDALVCAHDYGVVHRDLKPENIVLTTTGAREHAIVLDFGISALLNRSATADIRQERLTAPDEFLGTPAYSAPEQLRGDAPSKKSDLYAWGLVFLESLTGAPAVLGTTPAEAYYRQLSIDRWPLPNSVEHHALGDLLRWVLEKQVERRAGEAAQVFERLQALAVGDIADAAGYCPIAEAPSGSRPPREATEHAVLGPAGERRQMTAVAYHFALRPDRTGSAADQLDALLLNLRTWTEQVVQNSGGSLAHFSGVRAVALFGFPTAHELDARRAAHAALQLQAQLAVRAARIRQDFSAEVEGRCGIHTGLVTLRDVKGPIGDVTSLLLADVQTIADAAKAGHVLVSETTRSLLRRGFQLEPYAQHEDSAHLTSQPLYALLGESWVPEHLLDSSQFGGRLIGRARELEALASHWSAVLRGECRFIAIVGEAGIGKSRLLSEWRISLGTVTQTPRWWTVRCTPEAKQDALFPLVDLLRTYFGLPRISIEEAYAALSRHLERVGAEARRLLPLLCPWLKLPLPDWHPLPLAPQRQRELGIAAVSDLLLSLFDREPGVLLVEDIHWADATTLEWLTGLRSKLTNTHVLVVATSRPEPNEQRTWEPSADDTLSLTGLSDAEAARLVQLTCAPQSLDPALMAKMVRLADGVPLFLEELAQYALSVGTAHRNSGDAVIPESVRSLLEARLDRLGLARETAQVAAVFGREFELSALEQVASRTAADLLGDLEQLQSAGLIQRLPQGGALRYAYRHALIQATAYDSIPAAGRARIHLRVAKTLEGTDWAASEPRTLARHWALANEPSRAAPYCTAASMALLSRSAHRELVEHSTQAVEWMRSITDTTARDHGELDLAVPHILGLMATRGWADSRVREVVERALELLDQQPGYTRAFWVMFTVIIFHHSSGVNRKRTFELTQQLERLAAVAVGQEASVHRILAKQALLNCHYIDGNLAEAARLADAVSADYSVTEHGALAWQCGFDPLVSACTAGSVIWWMLGSKDKAAESAKRADARARQLQHPESLGLVSLYKCVIQHLSEDRAGTLNEARQLIDFAVSTGTVIYSVYANLFLGWATGNPEPARQALQVLEAGGQLLGFSYYATIVAETECASESPEQALHTVERAQAHAQATGELYWLPKVLCSKAKFLAAMGAPASVIEGPIREASEVARRFGSLTFEREADALLSQIGQCDESADTSIMQSQVISVAGSESPAVAAS